jgi:hypothetical protein
MEGASKMSKKETSEFTERVLLAMIGDMNRLVEMVERTKVQVFALARERGLNIPAGLI